MQGVIQCARFAFSPTAPKDAEDLYSYVVNKNDDTGAMTIIKKYSVYTMLRLISGKIMISAFDPIVVESYWLGTNLLDKIGASDLGLILKNFGYIAHESASIDKLIFGNAQLPSDERLTAHHSLSVLLNTMKIKEYNEDVIKQINDSIIRWGIVNSVDGDQLSITSAQLTRHDAFAIEENKSEAVHYDEKFAGPIKQGDAIAIHHGMAICAISLIQLANLKRYTLRNISVFNRLV